MRHFTPVKSTLMIFEINGVDFLTRYYFRSPRNTIVEGVEKGWRQARVSLAPAGGPSRASYDTVSGGLRACLAPVGVPTCAG